MSSTEPSLTARRLEGQVAIVTGAARGIGAAVAATLADDGAAVVIADIDIDGAEAVAATIQADGNQAIAIPVDLAEEASVAALVETTIDRYGRLDVLDNNAALTDGEILAQDDEVHSMSVRVWDRMMAINLRSQMLMSKHAIPKMLQGRGGSIINTSSGAALKGDLTRTGYSASKAGIESLTRSIATQYGSHGIRANTVIPGLILTESLQAAIPPELLDQYRATILTPRIGQPRDIADLVRFLASDESRYITGQSIVIDGGASAHIGVPLQRQEPADEHQGER